MCLFLIRRARFHWVVVIILRQFTYACIVSMPITHHRRLHRILGANGMNTESTHSLNSFSLINHLLYIPCMGSNSFIYVRLQTVTLLSAPFICRFLLVNDHLSIEGSIPLLFNHVYANAWQAHDMCIVEMNRKNTYDMMYVNSIIVRFRRLLVYEQY